MRMGITLNINFIIYIVKCKLCKSFKSFSFVCQLQDYKVETLFCTASMHRVKLTSASYKGLQTCL